MSSISAPNTTEHQKLLEQTVSIVAAYVAKQHVPQAELPALIAMVAKALAGSGKRAEEPVEQVLTPAVPIKKSVTPDFLISLEDGKHYKALKRHLAGLGLTPEAYREKWGLPKDYPMVAASYAARRSELAKALGLGRKRAEAAASIETVTEAEPEPTAKKARSKRAKT